MKTAESRTEKPLILDPSDILTPDELAARPKVRRTWTYEKMRSRSRDPLPRIGLDKYRRFD
jgi:hypothetical protein